MGDCTGGEEINGMIERRKMDEKVGLKLLYMEADSL